MKSGCNGAPSEAYPKWVVNQKLMHEYTYGYVAAASTYKCPTDKSYWKPGAKVTSYGMGKYLVCSLLAICETAMLAKKKKIVYWVSISMSFSKDYECSETKLQQLIMKYGSVMTGIHASDNGFKNYKSGVYDKCNPWVLSDLKIEVSFYHLLTLIEKAKPIMLLSLWDGELKTMFHTGWSKILGVLAMEIRDISKLKEVGNY